ncbi:hypothetical protein NK718_21125 [Alsobacter sp. SYSU M60028]|uniref:Uncharacterized protein n=1 Tax=Alsobacter ponti TaxID=2962936 RepID=A0ABT1LHX5_9HYPH|nr:hypothetical protein [Alsobacter ponti]MCP8941034.1 hypothetical protein [Alsobacter ponti]
MDVWFGVEIRSGQSGGRFTEPVGQDGLSLPDVGCCLNMLTLPLVATDNCTPPGCRRFVYNPQIATTKAQASSLQMAIG